jgi:serine/threonine protein kinase
MTICYTCGKINPFTNILCDTCGCNLAPVASSTKAIAVSCPYCRSRVPTISNFCPICGNKLKRSTASLSSRPDLDALNPSEIFCWKCDSMVSSLEGICLKCGARLGNDKIYLLETIPLPCPACNAPLQRGDVFCLECGYPLETSSKDVVALPSGQPSSPMPIVEPANTMIECPKCHTRNTKRSLICKDCGYPLNSIEILEEGTYLGRYVIEKLLGVGGIGAVYLANHQYLNQSVAIKVHSYFPEDEYIGSAFREASNYLSQLDHIHIVHFYDYGFEKKHAYQIMEFINGPTFIDIIPQQMSKDWIERCLEYFSQILAALQYAHNCHYKDLDGKMRVGMIHGDIKPQNIFLTRSGDCVKLADFMIPDLQAFLGQDHHDFSDLRANTAVLGTVGYMAPEQEKGYLTKQCDIYSLGATLYQMVTNREPINIVRMIQRGETPRNVNSYVPSWLEQVIMKAMELEPRRRFKTVGEIISIFSENVHNKGISYVVNTKEVYMSEKNFNIRTGDISSSGQMFIGEFNSVIANLDTEGKKEIADALKTLKEAVMASHNLSKDEKEEQIGVINQFGEEAVKPKPNKTLLKVLSDGLFSTLKVVPDIASAIGAIAPVLSQLHL